MKRNFSSGAVSCITIMYTLAFIIMTVVEIVFVCSGVLHFSIFVTTELSSFCILVLLFALNGALDRIEKLETALLEKKVIKEKDLEDRDIISYEEIKSGSTEGISLCKNCGYQIFNDDIVCPNCKQKIIRK